MPEEEEKRFIVCMPWKLRSPLSEKFSVKMQCSICGQDVVIESANVMRCQKENYSPACLECIAKPESIASIAKGDEVKIGGAMVNGQLFTDPIKTLEAIEEKIKQSRKEALDN